MPTERNERNEHQQLLSAFGGGDPTNVDLGIDDSNGYDLEGRRRIREYADRVATGGWVLAHAGDESIWWEHPNPTIAKTYRIKKASAGWHGYRAGRQAPPEYTADLQEALDSAAEWMAAHPIRDADKEER